MTSHVGRLYAAAVSLVSFFLLWAVVAAHPWATPRADPAVAALAARERQFRTDAAAVNRLVDRRWAAYRIALAARQKAIAAAAVAGARAPAPAPVATAPAPTAAPSVRVVTLPPLTVTKTS